jgi:hypothetical protein
MVLSVAIRRLDHYSALRVLPSANEIEGPVHDFVKHDGTGLILRYRKDGTFDGLSVPDHQQWLAFRQPMFRRLQGVWSAQVLFVNFTRPDIPRVWQNKYGVLVKENLIAYVAGGVVLAYLFEFDQVGTGALVSATYPDAADRAALNSGRTVWTGRRLLLPCGDDFMVFAYGGGTLELGFWSKRK